MKTVSRESFIASIPVGFIENLPGEAGIYVVGGALRDIICGIPYRELDLLVTSIPLDRLLKILRRFGKAEAVGRSFTVIKWSPRLSSETIDVSVPSRRDISMPDGGAVDPDMPVVEDLAQRDFTVDAMAFDLRTSEIIDPFHAIEDIEKHILKAVTDTSLEADPLRCIRGAYICAKCGLAVEPRTLELIRSTASDIKNIAPERIAEEIRKTLLLPKPSDALRLWRDWGLLDHFIPELAGCVGVVQEGGWHAYDVFEHLLHTVDASPPQFDVRLAALFHDIGKPARRKFLPERNRAIFYGHQNLGERLTTKIMSRLHFSKELTNRVAQLVRFHMFSHAETDKGIRRFIRRVGVELLDDLFELRFADIKAQGTDREEESDKIYRKKIMRILEEKPPLSPTDLAIDGNDIMNTLALNEGREVGEILEKLLEIVIDSPSKNTKDILIEELENMRCDRNR